MDNVLHVRMTETRHGEPLATVRNLPGGDADMTPAQMRALAQALLAAATDCEARSIGKKHNIPAEREYGIVATPHMRNSVQAKRGK